MDSDTMLCPFDFNKPGYTCEIAHSITGRLDRDDSIPRAMHY